MNEDVDQIHYFWKESLVKIQLNNIQRQLILDENRNFMENVGLPLTHRIKDQSLLRFGFDVNQFKIFDFETHTYLQLWEKENERLVIRKHTNQIFWLNVATPPPPIDGQMLFQPTQFTNSSIEKYIIFSTYYVMSLPRRNELFGANLDPQENLSQKAIEEKRARYLKEHKNILNDLVKSFIRIDDIAMNSKANYWSQKLSREAAMFYV